MYFKNSKLMFGIVLMVLAVVVFAGASFAYSDNNQNVVTFKVSDYSQIVNDIQSTGSDNGIQYNGVSLSRAQILYILTKSVSVIGTTGSDQGTFVVGIYNDAPHPSGDDFAQPISEKQYVDMSNRFSIWIEQHGQVPNFVGINQPGVPDISPTMMENLCIKILTNYEKTGELPGSVSTLYS
ncbi:MAG: hypothetical protein Q4P18_08180 [Methanobrevibacter sp.]|uniref:hypothetical protein n=1 Tax=Methanobrevibacter sp. TaxID=66852 RepID=UPI0026E0D969|nr:hypothetical protein [Methanobrevibacter sp.]MDO5849499.1 hypothetical protein [Methanobrevibacter sp.]